MSEQINTIGEFGFIKKIKAGCLIRKSNIIKSIGDDSAVFSIDSDKVLLVTTDLLIEKIHFLRNKISGFCLGYKSLAVNLSDIAAMGGIPREAFVSIGIPNDCEFDYLANIYDGMKNLASKFDVNILGGDTSRSETDLIINVCLIGIADKKQILYRNSAMIGDLIFCTGCIGDSRAGLHLLLHENNSLLEFKSLIDAHTLPKPYIKEGIFLASAMAVTAAIDISDGLASDIRHIMEESKVGAVLFKDKIPISDDLKNFCNQFKFDPIDFAIEGGEDYVLLFTVPKNKAYFIEKAYFNMFKKPLHLIGEITSTEKLEIINPDGSIKQYNSYGWNHFKK
ncbi:MAG: thiamine-phosphate kinase [Desulfobacterales bacterium]|nr:thiamine-phosphate kinase [Desulfobacterales bacterium]